MCVPCVSFYSCVFINYLLIRLSDFVVLKFVPMMEGENSICVECQLVEKDTSKLITCMYCFSEAHYKCRNIVGNAARRIKNTMYFCSLNCSSIYQRIMEMQNGTKSIVEALSAELKGVVASVVSQELMNFRTEVQQITTAIENSQQFLSDKFDSIVTDFQELKNENENLKLEVEKLKYTLKAMSKTVNTLELNVDSTARQANCNNAMVFGTPYLPEENTQEIVRNIITCYGLSIDADAIVSADRLGGRTKVRNSLIPIRVVFRNGDIKEEVFEKKKQFGKLISSSVNADFVINGKPTIISMRDELSPLGLKLLNEMREYQEKLNIKYVWSSRGGNILVKKTEHSKPEIIKTRNDLCELIDRYSKESPIKVTPSPKRKCTNNGANE